jgi:type IV pilus assembly protein PilQ
LDLQEAKVEHVLRLLSEIAGYNLILDEGVSGTVSLKLVDIPWDQALDLILLQKNLGMVKQGNLLRIATLEQLRRENEELQRAREAEARAKESLENVLPTRTEFIQINYSTAAEFESKVRELLSPRGKISADSRTNTLIVTDIDPVLQKVQSYIAKLDRPERQVLIEARLVYATDDFQRDIGIKWGATMQDESARDDEQYEWDASASGFNAPFGSTGLGLAGNIGKILGKDLWSLDASLRLGETKNLVKTVSSPRIVTLNNNRAEIKQGIKLATNAESESGGTTTEYTDAVLKISVQPQITPDNKLILDVEISDDSPTATGRDIETKSARTKMIVGDRETIVIGGVLKASDRSATEKIPGLGDVPVLGRLFRQDETASSKQELLIFLHPRIL